MTKMIQCISPVDGTVYAERPALTLAEAEAVVAQARAAQAHWAARPLEERIVLESHRTATVRTARWPWALQVLELRGDRIAEVHAFLDTEESYPRFGFPPHLP